MNLRHGVAIAFCFLGFSSCGGKTASMNRDAPRVAVGGAAADGDQAGGAGSLAHANSGGLGGASGSPEPEAEEGLACSDLFEELGVSVDEICEHTKIVTQHTFINLLVVLDKSASMRLAMMGSDQSKWATAIDVLTRLWASNSLDIQFGLLLFPDRRASTSRDETWCAVETGKSTIDVDIGPLSATAPLMQQLVANTDPGGGTTAAEALRRAYAYYSNGHGAALAGTKYVLLVTDGVANCCAATSGDAHCPDDLAVLGQISSLRDAGIRTLVVGVPGDEVEATYLNQFADSGGEAVVGRTRHYYETNGEYNIVDAFSSTTKSSHIICNLPLEHAPMDLSRVNVAVDCSLVPQRTGEQTNWDFDESTLSIVLLGPWCDQIQSQGVERIDVLEKCGCFCIE